MERRAAIIGEMLARIALVVLMTVVPLAGGCTSVPATSEDSRLEVAASVGRRRARTTNIMFTVLIRNVSQGILTIRRVEVDPIGGGAILPAHVTQPRRLEPGEPAEFSIWAELERGETVQGIGDALAKVIVSFDDENERVLATYLVELR